MRLTLRLKMIGGRIYGYLLWILYSPTIIWSLFLGQRPHHRMYICPTWQRFHFQLYAMRICMLLHSIFALHIECYLREH